MTDDIQAPVEAPAVESAPVVEVTTDPAPVIETPPAEPSYLGGDVVDPAPVEEVAPVEPSVEPENEGEVQSEEPAPLPTYDDFTLPEGITPDNELISNFTKDLAEFEQSTKADHAAMQEFGQKLIDQYVAESTKTAERISTYYQETFEKTKNQWKEDFEKDPELGGNRAQTTVDSAKSFIKTHGGDAAQQQAFHKLMDETGLGNHPVIIRLLANAGRNMQEGKPLPATSPVQPQMSKVAKRYGTL